MIENLLHFLNSCPTPWHVNQFLLSLFTKEGFLEKREEEAWDLQPEKKYTVQRQGTTLCAFVMPRKIPRSMIFLSSHTDSPGLKLKPRPEIELEGMVLLKTEVYGAPLLTSWLNRDLGIAGKVFYLNQKEEVEERLITIDEIALTIPQLAIHLDREVNEKGLLLNKQEHLNALVALVKEKKEEKILDTLLFPFIQHKELLAHDLFLYPLEKARLIGTDHSLLASYRIDSLASVHAIVESFLQEAEPEEDRLKIILFSSHEEIGSETSQGASSSFIEQTLERINMHLGGSREDLFRLLQSSLGVSVDLAHGVHPNHVEKHDAHHRPRLGNGVVIKYNAQQRYATNSFSAAHIKKAAINCGIALQEFVSRNDLPCGSTIGPLHSTKTGMPTVDIGCAQLSMHGCRELMACQDQLDMIQLLKQLLKSHKM